MAQCPACGQNSGAAKGQPTTHHQKPGGREKCPGVGQPAQ